MVFDQPNLERDELKIESILDGGVIEMLNHTLGQVFANIVDVNTDDGPREVNLKLKIKPDDTRSLVEIGVTVTPKLAGLAKATTLADVGYVNGRAKAFLRPKQQQSIPFEPRVAANAKGGM
jgi:hypothetical protein